ncbi:hypothetical protein Q3G72_002653 [Acer saccharum]|nr:hypothetical protein Q3G72_002653 [Acer saccharum]
MQMICLLSRSPARSNDADAQKDDRGLGWFIVHDFDKWLKKTKRKALFASLEKIKEELMLLGLISLLLAQWARGISEICVKSSLFSSKFYICSEKDYGTSAVEPIVVGGNDEEKVPNGVIERPLRRFTRSMLQQKVDSLVVMMEWPLHLFLDLGILEGMSVKYIHSA